MDTEKIVIKSLEEFLDDKLDKYTSHITNQVFNLVNIRALVIHQDTEKRNDLDIVNHLIETRKNPYHFYINEIGTIYQLNPLTRAVQHCRATQYTQKANEYFGDAVCPLFKDSNETPHPEASPDNCTVSILIARPSKDEPEYFLVLRQSLVNLCAYIINKYAKSLQGPANILNMQYISEEFKNQTYTFDYNTFNEIRYDVEKLRSKWFIEYKENHICDEEIQIIDMK